MFYTVILTDCNDRTSINIHVQQSDLVGSLLLIKINMTAIVAALKQMFDSIYKHAFFVPIITQNV